jgi:hypothetical protein
VSWFWPTAGLVLLALIALLYLLPIDRAVSSDESVA